MAAQINKSQHWVPRFYLRYFATPESRNGKHPQIWALPNVEGEEFLTNVSKVAAERYLYTPLKPGGGRDTTVDERLSEVETLLAQLWPKIANNDYPLDKGFRQGLSLFISTLYLRHPSKLQRHRHFRKAVMDAVAAAPKDGRGRPRIMSFLIGGQKYPIDTSDWEYFANATAEEEKASWNDTILSNGGFYAKYLMTLPWTVFSSNEEVFVTSDHPVVLTHRELPDPSLNAPGTIIQLPISPTRLLTIGDERFDDGKVFRLRDGGECDFNFLIFRSARRYLFSPWHPHKTLKGIVRLGEEVLNQRRSLFVRMVAAARAVLAA
jgi:hypothetical protein